MNKNAYNFWALKENEKICVFDLDDTLSNSIEYWLKFIETETGKKFDTLHEAKQTLSYNEYRNLKCKFRNSGTKINILCKDCASEVTQKLRERGFTIIIMTARPFKDYKNLFKVTIDWLDKNKIAYDGIIFGENKHVKAMTELENVKFIVEDHRYTANLCSKFGIRTYLLTNKYNMGETGSNVVRIKSLHDILECKEAK